jgi:hypothetical protein
MAISRLFFEMSGDSSKLNRELQKATATAKDAGVQMTRAGQALITKFDEALNPTKKLTEQVQLLEAAKLPFFLSMALRTFSMSHSCSSGYCIIPAA